MLLKISALEWINEVTTRRNLLVKLSPTTLQPKINVYTRAQLVGNFESARQC